MVLPLLVDKHLLVRLEVHELRDEVREADSVEQRVQVQLFVQPSVSVIKELLAIFPLLVTLLVLEAAAAQAEHPDPPGLPVGIPELRLRAKRLL